jgi:hypothetical protein
MLKYKKVVLVQPASLTSFELESASLESASLESASLEPSSIAHEPFLKRLCVRLLFWFNLF